MARSGIQYADVQQAIDTLLTQGDTPSVQRIREVLGTGSFTTISEHFRQWRSEREQNRDVPPPKGVPEVVVSAASALWNQAQEAANQALAHYREDANRQVLEAREAAERAEQHALDAEQREKALTEHLRHTEARLETLSRELATAEAAQAQLAEDTRRAERQAAEAKESERDSEQRYHALQESAGKERQVLQESWKQRLEQEEERNETAEGKLMATLDTLRQEHAQEEKVRQKRLRQWGEKYATLEKTLADERDHLKMTQADKQQLQERLMARERENVALVDDLDNAQRALAKIEERLEQERHQRERESTWQRQLDDQIEALHRQLSELPTSLLAKETPKDGEK